LKVSTRTVESDLRRAMEHCAKRLQRDLPKRKGGPRPKVWVQRATTIFGKFTRQSFSWKEDKRVSSTKLSDLRGIGIPGQSMGSHEEPRAVVLQSQFVRACSMARLRGQFRRPFGEGAV